MLNYTQKQPGAAFARMVAELRIGERDEKAELTRQILQAELTAARSGGSDHRPETRSLLARLFPIAH